MNINVVLYDRKTQFNDVPVSKINEAWGDVDYILVYKDNEFTGIAQPLGIKTLEEWKTYFDKVFLDIEQEKEDQQKEKTMLEKINDTTIQTDSYVLDLMEGVATSYEAQEENSMIVMEGLASIYES